jgi:hypothetical protein
MKSENTAESRGRQPAVSGVRGWLLVLCLYLMLLVPLAAVLGLVGAWQSAASSPALQSALIFEVLFELGLAAFALYAGMALYRIRPNAVAIAKIYFIVTLTLGTLGVGFILLGAVAQTSDRALANMLRGPAAFAVLRQIVVSAAWLFYLERSERVRTTYSVQ